MRLALQSDTIRTGALDSIDRSLQLWQDLCIGVVVWQRVASRYHQKATGIPNSKLFNNWISECQSCPSFWQHSPHFDRVLKLDDQSAREVGMPERQCLCTAPARKKWCNCFQPEQHKHDAPRCTHVCSSTGMSLHWLRHFWTLCLQVHVKMLMQRSSDCEGSASSCWGTIKYRVLTACDYMTWSNSILAVLKHRHVASFLHWLDG